MGEYLLCYYAMSGRHYTLNLVGVKGTVATFRVDRAVAAKNQVLYSFSTFFDEF